MSRDRFENAMRRVHRHLVNTTFAVFEPNLNFVQGEGWEVTYPDMPNTTVDGRLGGPSDEAEREVFGTTAEIEATVRVRDDTGQQWTSFGEEAEAPVRIEDTSDGTMYEVRDKVDRNDGLITLGVVEV